MNETQLQGAFVTDGLTYMPETIIRMPIIVLHIYQEWKKKLFSVERSAT